MVDGSDQALRVKHRAWLLRVSRSQSCSTEMDGSCHLFREADYRLFVLDVSSNGREQFWLLISAFDVTVGAIMGGGAGDGRGAALSARGVASRIGGRLIGENAWTLEGFHII